MNAPSINAVFDEKVLYASLFFLTGALLLAMTFVAWSTIERERAEQITERP